jgi:hypothetical protein
MNKLVFVEGWKVGFSEGIGIQKTASRQNTGCYSLAKIKSKIVNFQGVIFYIICKKV